MAPAVPTDLDSLTSLEERITKAVDLVLRLRSEKEALAEQIEELVAERDEARKEAEDANLRAQCVAQELEDLRSERKQVRARIEKLLSQMELLSAS